MENGHDHPTRHILVVDDELSILHAVERELKGRRLGRYAFTVAGFTDPRQALVAAEQHVGRAPLEGLAQPVAPQPGLFALPSPPPRFTRQHVFDRIPQHGAGALEIAYAVAGQQLGTGASVEPGQQLQEVCGRKLFEIMAGKGMARKKGVQGKTGKSEPVGGNPDDRAM